MPFAIFTGLAVTACAQTNVPAAVKASFAKEFKGATAKWDKEGDKYEANFRQMGHEMSALYLSNGTMTESEMEIKVNELPKEVSAYLNANKKGEKISEASKITKPNGDVNYEAEVGGEDLIFDSKGKFLKVSKE